MRNKFQEAAYTRDLAKTLYRMEAMGTAKPNSHWHALFRYAEILYEARADILLRTSPKKQAQQKLWQELGKFERNKALLQNMASWKGLHWDTLRALQLVIELLEAEAERVRKEMKELKNAK